MQETFLQDHTRQLKMVYNKALYQQATLITILLPLHLHQQFPELIQEQLAHTPAPPIVQQTWVKCLCSFHGTSRQKNWLNKNQSYFYSASFSYIFLQKLTQKN